LPTSTGSIVTLESFGDFAVLFFEDEVDFLGFPVFGAPPFFPMTAKPGQKEALSIPGYDRHTEL
jgi:hypothetical protein